MEGFGALRSARLFVREETGQTVVLMALTFTVMLGFAALAVDAGRYYAERRSLQDSVDAAALACARAYSQPGASSTDAYNAAKTILENYNFKNSPTGLAYEVPPEGTLTYYDNITEPLYLKNGVRPQLTPYIGCRVAVYIDVPTTLLKIASPGLQTIALNARAYAIAKGGMQPIVVQKYANAPGPGTSDGANFVHHTMREGSDYQCTATNEAACTAADSTNMGREFVLFGQGAAPVSGGNQFRGYIALDIRDFTSNDGGTPPALVHTAYNGVAANASVNTLKDFEASWIREGYPGPDLCEVVSANFLPCAQVAIIDGTSAGIFIDEVADRFTRGDKILAQLYDGTVKTIPNFTINFPSLVIANSTATVATQTVAFTFSDQFADSQAVVNTTFHADDGTITGGSGDDRDPWRASSACVQINAGCAASSGSLSSTPVSTPDTQDPSYNMSWTGVTVTSVPQGIYVVFLKGSATDPYTGTEQFQVVSVNIAEQQKQFYLDTSDTYANTPNTTTNATYTIRVTDANSTQLRWTTPSTYPITLQIDQCPKNGSTTLTCYFGTTSPGTQSEQITSLDATRTLTVVPTADSSGKTFTGWIRASGIDQNGSKVTRVLKIRTAVSVTAGGTENYVDVVGFAVFQVTCVKTSPDCPNDVKGKAVTGTFTNVNDPALAMGKKYGLVPWETP